MFMDRHFGHWSPFYAVPQGVCQRSGDAASSVYLLALELPLLQMLHSDLVLMASL